ncbi:Bacteriophage protein gp37 [Streptococcus criceti]|uniref:Phage protein Gp37/Gp68 n=1 Tax=Streptococcus criceti HS-6 TaxID=873449 RepID=G5JNV2_STRCG|nr:DUF5131 family protein [Streptococcus criceti]EHI73895.1 hypothetical protein STRCR_1483 [Streptococcus criceti HS-6]SUN43278.1 Bacteriophage protein gp37 [Streptococcus criceti]
MHDTWNPWHGCRKVSEGCNNCYMYYLDHLRGKDGRQIYRTKLDFTYPLQKDRQGNYKVKSGEMLRVCMTSDFFLEEADEWREEVWNIIWQRPDVKFWLLTKRPERVRDCLPKDWGDGWENVMLNVSCENQKRADERIPLLLDLPFKHKGIMCAPLLGPIDIKEYLATGQLEQVNCGGENYGGARPCHYEWVKQLSEECRAFDVLFAFVETGTNFVKDGKTYHLPNKRLQSQMAFKSNLSHKGKPIQFKLFDSLGLPLAEEELHKPTFKDRCQECGIRIICNGYDKACDVTRG